MIYKRFLELTVFQKRITIQHILVIQATWKSALH